MVPDARVTVLLPGAPERRSRVLTVPVGTPVGGVWGHLPRDVGAGGPPPGVRYLLNGMRTIPGAPLRDGDTLEISASHEEAR